MARWAALVGVGVLALAPGTAVEAPLRPDARETPSSRLLGVAWNDEGHGRSSTWSRTVLDEHVSSMTLAEGRLVATGPRAGIRVFDLGGRPLYRRFDGGDVWLHLAYRGRIAATVGSERTVRVLELATGKTLARRPMRRHASCSRRAARLQRLVPSTRRPAEAGVPSP